MSRFKAYLELIRYPLFAIPIVATLPGALIASEGQFTRRVAATLLIALCGYFAGMIKNDYFHHETDKNTNPERPLPSQRLTPRQAIVPASVIYGLCVIGGFWLNIKAGLLVMGLVAISHLYNAIFKAKGILGSLTLPLGIGLSERLRSIGSEWDGATIGMVCLCRHNALRFRHAYYHDLQGPPA